MKVTFGRKFFAGILAILVLVYFFTMTLIKAPQVLTASVLIFFGSMVVTVCFAYIGGNVWKSWIISKHFQENLLNPPGN